MAQATTSTGAESIRWDLTDLFASPTDPAVEALMDLRDPSAIGPLNNLTQTEVDRKVPRTLIKHAIDACATSAAEPAPSGVSSFVPAAAPKPSLPVEHEREVIEL